MKAEYQVRDGVTGITDGTVFEETGEVFLD